MQIKIPMRYQYTQIKMGKKTNKQTSDDTKGWWICGKTESFLQCTENVKWYSYSESNLAVS